MLYAAALAASGSILITTAWKAGCDKQIFWNVSWTIPAWLIACTVRSYVFNFHQVNIGPLPGFTLFGFLLCVKFRNLSISSPQRILAWVSVMNLLAGILMLTWEPATQFMVAHFNNYYEELLPAMVSGLKPVTVFATHSLAGTFAYLFFFLNFRAYKQTGGRISFWLAVLHVGMCLAMMSTTSLLLSALAVGELIYVFKWRAIALFSAIVLLIPSNIREASLGAVQLFWGAEGNGFLARYQAGGTMHLSIMYLIDHPFLPLGFAYPGDDLRLIDSGPIEYLLMGSIPLLLLVYGGFFLFLRRNLVSKWDCYRLFAVLLATEIGIPVLTYARSLLLIPAFMILLNSLPQEARVPRRRLLSTLWRAYTLQPFSASQRDH